ncbi:hypothetical protein [Roseicella sp. DB1501]|uniref:hypothetical protein n=1 Tax=Roseicella sp. DB1501 TaxID=2730925 RepID=UPI001491663E|nr:hypothetical protein [Roseicella sp. DB1501]NOG69332.1 hypothetical protein [Roseicella sp. DB1501]
MQGAGRAHRHHHAEAPDDGAGQQGSDPMRDLMQAMTRALDACAAQNGRSAAASGTSVSA